MQRKMMGIFLNLGRCITVILFATLCLALMPNTLYAASETDNMLTISVTSITDTNDGKAITIEFDNQTGRTISLGWASTCDLIVETDSGVFSITISFINGNLPQIQPGDCEYTFDMEGCTGSVNTITLSDVRSLGDDGLPDQEYDNICIFDTEGEVTAVTLDLDTGLVDSIIQEQNTENTESAEDTTEANHETDSLPTTQIIQEEESSDNKVTIAVTDITDTNDGKAITIEFDNQTDRTISLAWVNTCDLIVDTDNGTSSITISLINGNLPQIQPGDCEYTFDMEGCTGIVNTITLSDVRSLGDNGLPDQEYDNICIFDTEGEVTAATLDLDTGLVDSIIQEQNTENTESTEDTTEEQRNIGNWFSHLSYIRNIFVGLSQYGIFFVIILIPILICILYFLQDKRTNRPQPHSYPKSAVHFDPSSEATSEMETRKAQGLCLYCASKLREESTYCDACGKLQVPLFACDFRRGSLSEAEYIQQMNEWFSVRTDIILKNHKFSIKNQYGIFVNSSLLTNVWIEYISVPEKKKEIYQITSIEDFGLFTKNPDVLLDKWKMKNPDVTIIGYQVCIHQRGTGSFFTDGFGANNKTQIYLIFLKK